MMKVQISVDDELMKRVDTFADENYMSRSTLFTIAVTQYVNAQDVTKAIKEMAVAMKKIADTGKVDHEVMEELEDFQRLAKMLSIN
jgi:metal-responsive CopG/Arc/MetJ family transcriptional regulator